MTLLEFACEKLMGPAASRTGGQSYWSCPHHQPDEHPSFCTLPHKPPFKDRFKCWTCDFRGDIFDLLLEFYPSENYGDRLARVAEFERQYKDAQAANAPSISSGDGGGSRAEIKQRRDVEIAFADLSLPERCVMATAARIERRLKLTPSPLGDYCLHFELWSIEQVAIARLVEEEEQIEQERIERIRRSFRKGPVVNAAVRRNGKPH